MKKRSVSLLLAAVMIITMFPLLPLTARAVEGTRIEDIPVTVTAPTIGKTTETAPVASVPADAGCSVTETLWVDEDYKELTAPVTFSADQTYLMEIVIDTDEGYYCTQSGGSHVGTTVTVTGGTLIDSWIYNMSDAEGNPHSTVYAIVSVQAQPPQIAEVSLSVTPPSAGKCSVDAKPSIAVTGEGVGSYYATWKDYTGYMVPEPTEIDFVSGRTYYAVITLFAAEGYTFKKGYSHDLDVDACDYYFGGEVNVTGAELYNNKANVRSTADPEYMKIWITVKAGEAAKCTVSFDPGTGKGEMDPVKVSAGDTYELPACTFTHANAERVFYMWDVGGELKNPGDKITVNGDITVTAKWKYTASDALINNSQDLSTTNYVGILVLTDTRTGVTTTETLYNETAASACEEPVNQDVSKLSGACVSTLMTALYSYPSARFISDDKPKLNVDSAEIVNSWNHIVFRFEAAVDEAGDYIPQMYMEGDFGREWRYTETVTGEYTSTETSTVSFAPGTGKGEMAPATVNTGETYELPACTFTHANAERVFYMWDVGGELYEPGVKITVAKDTVVTAVWKYTGAAATVDNAVDKSTTEVLGALTLTDTRTGEVTAATVFDEVTASSFVNPSNPTVNAMIEEAQGVLAEKAGEKAGGSELTTVKDGVENLKVAKFDDSRTFTYSYLKDEAGDYYQALTIEGTYYKIWQYTVVLEVEYASAEAAVKLGDVDFDGNITASDARLALRRAVGLEDYAPGSPEFIACDVDVDNTVTAGDARSILRAAVELEDPDLWGK